MADPSLRNVDIDGGRAVRLRELQAFDARLQKASVDELFVATKIRFPDGTEFTGLGAGESAAIILSKLLGVDGSGSGLDADFLDSRDSSLSAIPFTVAVRDVLGDLYANAFQAESGSAATPAFGFSADPDTGFFRAGTNSIGITCGGTERIRVDSSGNLSIGGVAPSGHSASYPALYVNSGQMIGPSLSHVTNAYFDGVNWRFIGTGYATAHNHNSATGTLIFYTSTASGTAGNVVTFAERWRTDATGQLGIGVTPSYRLHLVVGATSAIGTPGSTGGHAVISGPGSPVSVRETFGTDGTGWQRRWAKNQGGTTTDLMTLTDGGYLGVNNTAPDAYLDIVGGAVGRGLQVTQSVTNVVDGIYYNEFNLTETNVDVGANILNALRLNHTVTGTSTTGARNSLEVALTHDTATSSGNTLRYYCAAAFVSYSKAGDGGSSGSYKGAYYGINPIAALGDGGSNDATYVANATAVEANVSVRTGSSVYYKAGIQIVGLADDAVQGTGYDAMLSLSGQGGVGWKNGILFSPANGAAPLDATVGTLIKTEGADDIYRGIDISSYGFSDWAVYLKNTTNSAASRGLRIETTYGASDGTILEASIGGRSDPALRVDGDVNDPIWITVNGSFRKVVAGAADSAGTGYRTLRVAN